MLSRRRTSLRWKRSWAHSTGSRTCSNPSAPSSSQAGYTALRHQLARHRWIAQHPAITIDRAKYLVMIWMGVAPSIE
jgi:hypothetical protein